MKNIEKDDEVAKEIISTERAALDRWGKGDVSGYTDISASEVTYFDTATERRIDGLKALKAHYAPIAGKIQIERYDMLNPMVQLHGNTAVLTFNLIDHLPATAGLKKEKWNATEIYCKIDGKWKIIHTHWSHIKAGE